MRCTLFGVCAVPIVAGLLVIQGRQLGHRPGSVSRSFPAAVPPAVPPIVAGPTVTSVVAGLAVDHRRPHGDQPAAVPIVAGPAVTSVEGAWLSIVLPRGDQPMSCYPSHNMLKRPFV